MLSCWLDWLMAVHQLWHILRPLPDTDPAIAHLWTPLAADLKRLWGRQCHDRLLTHNKVVLATNPDLLYLARTGSSSQACIAISGGQIPETEDTGGGT